MDREGEGVGMGYHRSPGEGGSVDPGARASHMPLERLHVSVERLNGI